MGDSRVSSAGVRDATMVDIGVKSRPPGAPPDDPGNPVVPTHDADGFTPVRQRKTVAQVNRNVNAQGGARVNVNRNPRDHVRKKGNELVVTSNSFGVGSKLRLPNLSLQRREKGKE
ncbi:unnamed protein product [Arabidopsis thaliana]|uniref:(thale cress) hypothetical protein n=1 Tax=Arabidopsis thaliana TaxID=3702 RepID=A0A7G2EU23_ARATH|nr:unnamed protein product [Arabidopsis thaliana]